MTTGRLPGLVLITSGIACALEASTFEVAFLTDPVGPKALPYIVSLVLVLAGGHALLRPHPSRGWASRPPLLRAAAATGALLLYSLALPFGGFFTSTTAVVALLSTLFGAPLRRAVPAAAILSGGLWVVFVIGLGLPLPIGSLWIR